MLRITAKAELAFAARLAGTDGDSVARAHTGNLIADRLDGARHFMPENDRLGDADRADATFPVIVDVGTTDAARANADQHLARPDFADFPLFNTDIFLRMQNTSSCFHDPFPPMTTV